MSLVHLFTNICKCINKYATLINFKQDFVNIDKTAVKA